MNKKIDIKRFLEKFNQEYEFLYEDIRDGKYALNKEQMLYLTIAGNKFKYLIDALRRTSTSNIDDSIVTFLSKFFNSFYKFFSSQILFSFSVCSVIPSTS